MEAAIRREVPDLIRQGVRIRVLAGSARLPDSTRDSIAEAIAATAHGQKLALNIAFNYSGRSEIVDAVRGALADGISPEEVDEEHIEERLYTARCRRWTCSSARAASSE